VVRGLRLIEAHTLIGPIHRVTLVILSRRRKRRDERDCRKQKHHADDAKPWNGSGVKREI
jgi:hypothetical protein